MAKNSRKAGDAPGQLSREIDFIDRPPERGGQLLFLLKYIQYGNRLALGHGPILSIITGRALAISTLSAAG
jgi:hypothetical protein